MKMVKRNYDMYRYHQQVYFPKDYPQMVLEFINTFEGDVDLTTHAAEEMYDDKRGRIPLPTFEEILDHDNLLIEFYERLDHLGRIQKAAIRVKCLHEDYDYTYVIARGGVIVTAWTNDKDDQHRLTESRTKYIQNENDERLLINS